jgi:sterol desaturase/sphingolipid hydroxylase (fatty acid hydroxylase superfamily)
VIVVLWLPVILAFLWRALIYPTRVPARLRIPMGFAGGAFIWTLAEYTLHRFVFHYRPRTPRQERIVFLFHGVHHAQPQCKTRLVMPPVVSVPLATLFYSFFHLVVGKLLGFSAWVDALFAGFGSGYLAYDLTHYATHHFRMRAPGLRYLKRYHMQHHYKTPNQRFGVSSPLWDIVFGTKPE